MFPIRLAGAAAVLVTFSSGIQAQTGANTVGDFTMERVLTLASVTSPTAPTLPPAVLAGLQSGALEIHQVFVYNSGQRTLEQTAFVVPGGSPLPFPNAGAAPLADHYIIQADSAGTTSTPGSSAVLVGHVTSNDAPTPWGNITGAIVTLAFGFHGSASATQFGPIMESVSPVYGLYTATGVGSLAPTATPQKCSLATLNGTYMFQLSGFYQSGSTAFGPAFGPFVDNGRFTADGNGNIAVFDSGNVNGVPFLNRSFSLTYTLDGNCVGSFKSPTLSIDVQVSKDGRRLNMVFTQPSSLAASGSGQLQ